MATPILTKSITVDAPTAGAVRLELSIPDCACCPDVLESASLTPIAPASANSDAPTVGNYVSSARNARAGMGRYTDSAFSQ